MRFFGNRFGEEQLGFYTFGDALVHDMGLLRLAMQSVAQALAGKNPPDYAKLKALCRIDAPSTIQGVLHRVQRMLEVWQKAYGDGKGAAGDLAQQRDWSRYRFAVDLPAATPFDAGGVSEMPLGWELLEIHLRELGKNAIKYGEDFGRIYFDAERNGIVVENDGPGFPTGFEIRPGVRFAPERAEGTGLGLAALLKDAERFGWTVMITSRPGLTQVVIALRQESKLA